MPIFQPTDVSGLFAWYKAHSITMVTSGVVTYWQDSSGSGNHLSYILPSSNSTCPYYVPSQLNGYPVIRFDGSNDYLAGTDGYFGSLAPSSLTTFVVYKSNSSSAKQVVFANDNDDAGSPTLGAKNNFILGMNNTSNASGLYFGWGKDKGVTIYITNSHNIRNVNPQWYVRSDRWRTTDHQFTWGLNGVDITGGYTMSMSQSINNRLRVGATVVTSTPEDFFNGDVAEIAAYSRRLNETEVGDITNYLLYKYNIPNTSPVSLFMWTTDNGSSSGLYNTIPLYTYSVNIESSGINLYTTAPYLISTGIPLYLNSASLQSSGKSLYIPGSFEYSSVPLYMYGHTTSYSGIPLYTASSTVAGSGFSIYMTGYPTTYTSTIPLYIGSSEVLSTGINLYISAATTSASSFSLFTSAVTDSSSGSTLFIPGQTESASKSLYIYGHESFSGNIPLYIGSTVEATGYVPFYVAGKSESTNSLLLFIKQLPPGTSTKYTTLFTEAASNGSSGIYKPFPLYMYSHGLNDSMVLFVKNGNADVTPTGNSYMPLFIKAPNLNSGIDNYVSMLVYNNVTITGKMTKLYIRGDGVMDGALIYNDNMNLFLKVNAGIERGASLYIENNSNITSGINMYTHGIYNYSSGIGLYVRGLFNHSSGVYLNMTGMEGSYSGLPIFVNGGNYTILNNNLYTHGF